VKLPSPQCHAASLSSLIATYKRFSWLVELEAKDTRNIAL